MNYINTKIEFYQIWLAGCTNGGAWMEILCSKELGPFPGPTQILLKSNLDTTHPLR
jgi:hypothetical protein